jgi:hypothetical protein
VNYFKTGSTSWEYLSDNTNSNILSCFQSYDGQAYLLGYDSSIFYVYNPSDIINPLFYSSFPSHTGYFLHAYRAYDAFYVIYSGIASSIFRFNQFDANTLNLTSILSSGYIVAATVTDDGKIFIICGDTATTPVNFYLMQVISDGNYPTLLYLGNDNDLTFKFYLDSLDNNHLVIGNSDLDNGLKGMFIYNTQTFKIEKYITPMDIVALHVPRY